MPNAKYRSRLRRVLHLLNRENVVEASDLLDELKRDARQFELFTQSRAYRPFCIAINSIRDYWRVHVEHYESMLVVLSYIQTDLRPARRPTPKAAKASAKETIGRRPSRTPGRRR